MLKWQNWIVWRMRMQGIREGEKENPIVVEGAMRVRLKGEIEEDEAVEVIETGREGEGEAKIIIEKTIHVAAIEIEARGETERNSTMMTPPRSKPKSWDSILAIAVLQDSKMTRKRRKNPPPPLMSQLVRHAKLSIWTTRASPKTALKT